MEAGVLLGIVREGIVVGKRVVTAIEHTNRRGDNLLGTHTGNETDIEFPVEALRRENGFHSLAHPTDIGLLLLFLIRQLIVVGEIA